MKFALPGRCGFGRSVGPVAIGPGRQALGSLKATTELLGRVRAWRPKPLNGGATAPGRFISLCIGQTRVVGITGVAARFLIHINGTNLHPAYGVTIPDPIVEIDIPRLLAARFVITARERDHQRNAQQKKEATRACRWTLLFWIGRRMRVKSHIPRA